ncbi:unnamed protein product [Symbiodinium natans]|uniref:Copper transporter n=1 Tax=Symbiodinium natans TaxID=878477 RepID=A0A812NIY4_9DINO|nr:unnamed protein product [Symbiodinium natans]
MTASLGFHSTSMGRFFMMSLLFLSDALVSVNRTDRIEVVLNTTEAELPLRDMPEAPAARAHRSSRSTALQVVPRVWPLGEAEDTPPPFRTLHLYMAVSMILGMVMVACYRSLQWLCSSGPTRPLQAHDPLEYAFKARQLQRLRQAPAGSHEEVGELGFVDIMVLIVFMGYLWGGHGMVSLHCVLHHYGLGVDRICDFRFVGTALSSFHNC